jgi:hypothetical protein
MDMYWNKAALDRRAAGSDEALGAVVGPVRVRMPPPFVSIVAPGNRMKVTPLPVSEDPPTIVKVPDMKYTPGVNVTAVLPFVLTPSFVHGVAAV